MLRSISTRVALAALVATASTAASDAPLLRAELELAARPEIYLVLSPAAAELTVKARGMALDRVAVDGVWWRYQAPWLGAASPRGPHTPAILTVRREPIPSPVQETEGGPAARRAGQVRALLDGGLELVASADAPRTGRWRRLLAALGGAWSALLGEEPDRGSALVLQVAAGELDRVARWLERDRRILLADARPRP